MSQQRLFSPPTAPGSSFIQHVSSGPGLTRPASVGKQQPSSANITTGGNARPGSTALPQSPRLGTSPGASHPAETSQHLPLTSMLDQSKPKRQTASPQGNSNPAPLRQAHPPPPSAAHSSDPQALTSSVGAARENEQAHASTPNNVESGPTILYQGDGSHQDLVAHMRVLQAQYHAAVDAAAQIPDLRSQVEESRQRETLLLRTLNNRDNELSIIREQQRKTLEALDGSHVRLQAADDDVRKVKANTVGLTIALQDIIRQHKIRHEELQAVKRTQAAELEAARKEVDCLVSELKTAQTQNEQHGDNSASIVAAVAVATVELRREKALIEEAHAETRRELIATQGTLAAKANMLQAREETMAAHAEMRHMKDRQIEALKRTEARLEEDIQARKTLMANFVAQKRELEERQSMLEAKLQTQRARVSKHKKALEESVVNVNGLMARQEKLSTAKKDALALVDQATAELNVLRLELAALKTPSNEQKNASQELVVQRDALMAELAELKKDSSGKISAQLAQLKSLEDARAGLAIQNEALTAEVKTLSTDFHAKNEDLGRLIAVTTDAGRLRDELVTAEQRIAGLLNAEGANRGELDQARIQIATLEETCAKQNEMLETWAAKEKTFSAKAEKMQLERQELKSELRKFKEVLKKSQIQHEQVVKELENEVRELRSRLSSSTGPTSQSASQDYMKPTPFSPESTPERLRTDDGVPKRTDDGVPKRPAEGAEDIEMKQPTGPPKKRSRPDDVFSMSEAAELAQPPREVAQSTSRVERRDSGIATQSVPAVIKGIVATWPPQRKTEYWDSVVAEVFRNEKTGKICNICWAANMKKHARDRKPKEQFALPIPVNCSDEKKLLREHLRRQHPVESAEYNQTRQP